MMIAGENDVLLGRGTPVNNHKGNITFRHIVKFYKEKYLCTRNSYMNYLITMEVQQRIKRLSPPGRFLRHDSNTNTLVGISDKDAQQKISQALRENTPSARKFQKNDKTNQDYLNHINESYAHKSISSESEGSYRNSYLNSFQIFDTNQKKMKQKKSIQRNTSGLQMQSFFSQNRGEGGLNSQSVTANVEWIDSTSCELNSHGIIIRPSDLKMVDEEILLMRSRERCNLHCSEDNMLFTMEDIDKSIGTFDIDDIPMPCVYDYNDNIFKDSKSKTI